MSKYKAAQFNPGPKGFNYADYNKKKDNAERFLVRVHDPDGMPRDFTAARRFAERQPWFDADTVEYIGQDGRFYVWQRKVAK